MDRLRRLTGAHRVERVDITALERQTESLPAREVARGSGIFSPSSLGHQRLASAFMSTSSDGGSGALSALNGGGETPFPVEAASLSTSLDKHPSRFTLLRLVREVVGKIFFCIAEIFSCVGGWLRGI